MKAGIISDTHNLLRPEVLSRLEGCDVILHAGDLCQDRILTQLQTVAPVLAVRGNNDRAVDASVPVFREFDLDGIHGCMVHQKKDLPEDLSAYQLVILGHTHQYSDRTVRGVRFLNPGSCGPRRFYQPITMAIMTTDHGRMDMERIELGPSSPARPQTAQDLRTTVEVIAREYQRGKGADWIAHRHGFDPALVEQVVRLIVTHPGVTVDGVLGKMGF